MKKYLLLSLLFFLSVASAASIAQNKPEKFKDEALKQMKAGRYGEAIDLLNKYVAAVPQRADGYNLRGLCYEKRGELESAVHNFRLAKKLAPNDGEINNNLKRATDAWYAGIYKKIKGHEREIAINPGNPVNYLEIGKCYKRLGEWSKAEEWYDKYLSMTEPSADEVIRYTEIVAKTNHLTKGEVILKRFTEKLPNDHRIWSRYGYFTLWLGKTQIAIDAFKKALALRPFFKEAQDGLDQAMGNPYIYTYYDTSGKIYTGPVQQQQQQAPEYAIDKYYRLLKNKPEDDATRFLLVDELIKAERLEEALTELKKLAVNNSSSDKYKELEALLEQKRQTSYTQKIDLYANQLKQNPDDQKALLEIIKYYTYLDREDEAVVLIQDYLAKHESNADPEIRYLFAKTAANNQDFDTALEQMDMVLQQAPDNQDYRLFTGMLLVWMEEQDLNRAREYLEAYYAKYPDKIEGLMGLVVLETKDNNFTKAEEYLAIVKKKEPGQAEIPTLESNIETQKLRYEQEQLFLSLESARQLFRDGRCEEAVVIYDQFFAKATEVPRMIRREYADILACAGNYDGAIAVYDELLAVEYDPVVEISKYKLLFEKGDYQASAVGLEKLVTEGNADFTSKLYLGESYQQLERYSEARDLYDKLLDETQDTSEIRMINQRIAWLPVTGFRAFFDSFPDYVLLYPSFYYYNDNTGFNYMYYGGGIELGLFQYVSIAASYFRGQYQTKAYAVPGYFWPAANITYNQLMFSVLGRYDVFTAGFAFGNLQIVDYSQKKYIYEGFVRAEKEKVFYGQVSFSRNDAAQVLYSGGVVNFRLGAGKIRLSADTYRLQAWYLMRSGFKFAGNISHFRISDGNSGTNFELRLGKYIFPEWIIGYEYYSTSWVRKSNLYYSPQEYESHSLWNEVEVYKDEQVTFMLGGKFGFIPSSDYILKDIFADIRWKPIPALAFSAKVSAGNTVREATGYSSQSFFISAYWTL